MRNTQTVWANASNTLSAAIDHQDIDAALRQVGSAWSAAQAHGLLCSKLAVTGIDGGADWLRLVLEGVDAPHADSVGEFENLMSITSQSLRERQSDFEPLLPDDSESVEDIVAALAEWSEGYLHGLVSDVQSESLKERLAAEPISDIIKDLLEITRAGVGEDEDPGDSQQAVTELIEYLRVAAQLVYEELADLRRPVDINVLPESDVIH